MIYHCFLFYHTINNDAMQCCLSSMSQQLPVLSVGQSSCILNNTDNFHGSLTIVEAF